MSERAHTARAVAALGDRHVSPETLERWMAICVDAGEVEPADELRTLLRPLWEIDPIKEEAA